MIMIQLQRLVAVMRVHKKASISAITVTILFLITICGILLSQRTWNDYSHAYSDSYQEAKTQIDLVIIKTSYKATDKNLADKLNAISKVQSKLSVEIGSYCAVGPMIKWQSFISHYSQEIKDCERQQQNLSKLLDDMAIVTSYFKSELQIASSISLANEKSNQNNQPDKWSMNEAFWRKAATDVGKISNTDQIKVLKTLSVTNLTKIADAWKLLSGANIAKDRQQFETARTGLSTAYASLNEVSGIGKSQVVELVGNLDNSYEKAFQT